jgi:pyruvate dehydrogenase E2 component (dihydrolipoamide acetyltransferase)
MAQDQGIIVPVLHRADEMSLLEIAQNLRDLASRAKEGTLSPNEVMGASFTITSLASFDIDAFTPIIDPPQIAILGVGRIVEKPAVYEGEIAKRSMMYLSLTFDHRATDGAPAGRFLQAIKRTLEKPG